jgi:hypothetical protein
VLFRALHQNRDAGPNFAVDHEATSEMGRAASGFLESCDAFKRDHLIARQCAENPMHGFDLWNR